MPKRSWFVSANVTRRELSEGEWVDFKDELSYGEQRAIDDAAVKFLSANRDTGQRQVGIDSRAHAVEELYQWLADWSLDRALSRETVAALKADRFEELRRALDAHRTALLEPAPTEEAEAAHEKKVSRRAAKSS